MSKAAAIIIPGSIFKNCASTPTACQHHADGRTRPARRLLHQPADVSRLHRGDGPGAVHAAARRLGGRRGRRGAIHQGHRREPLQGGEHGRRRGDRRGDQRDGGPRLPLRVRRRRRELRGAGRTPAAGAAGAGRDRDLGHGRPRSDVADRHGAGRRRFARRASMFASRATRRRRISRSRCSPAAASPGPTPP